jgi:hypothetical protein
LGLGTGEKTGVPRSPVVLREGEIAGGVLVRDGALPGHGGRVFLSLQLVEELSERRELLPVIAHDAEVGIAEDPVPCAF